MLITSPETLTKHELVLLANILCAIKKKKCNIKFMNAAISGDIFIS